MVEVDVLVDVECDIEVWRGPDIDAGCVLFQSCKSAEDWSDRFDTGTVYQSMVTL
jgi:hypothetical protein